MKRKVKRGPRRSRRAPELEPSALPVLPAGRGGTANPSLSGGDVDADWRRAEGAGDEAVGGTVSTPDQDVVGELGRAVGVEQGPTEEVRTSAERLQDRDERRWELEWEATGRPPPPSP